MVGDTKIFESYKLGIEKLKQAGVASPKMDTLVLLCKVLDCDRTYIYAHGDEKIPNGKLSQFVYLIDKRASHIPLQHLTGFQEFMSLKFFVDSSVLIPRQDTEILVETVLEEAVKFSPPINILEIGTGSGCIAISISSYLKDCTITALDISTKALNIAKNNATHNHVLNRINFIESNLFSNVPPSKFDIIVSNPPYIPSKDILTLMPEVKLHEPLTALDGGIDGLDFYKRIIKGSISRLNQNGLLAFEVGIYQANSIIELMENHFCKISTKKDLSGIDRVIFGYLNP